MLATSGKKLVSIVAPFFNEGDGVGAFHENICHTIAKLDDLDFEIVCVDDGSHDDTLLRLIDLVSCDKRFRVVELSRNFGKEAALTAGVDIALGDAVIPIDADLQDPPELIPVLIGEWQKGADVVLARRIDRSSDSFLKRKTAEIFYRAFNLFSAAKIPEDVGDFRLMNRAAINALKQLPERQRFMKGLFAWVGFKTVTIDYARNARLVGATKFSGWKLWNFALEGITSFSLVPLKIWSYVGAMGAMLTFSYAAFIVVRTLIYGVDVPGYASLLVAVLFFGSLQLISVGVLGEYLGRIYMETKQRPIYLVRKLHEAKEET
jgi:glycosyltransferase involved in cell wall biosynthesis